MENRLPIHAKSTWSLHAALSSYYRLHRQQATQKRVRDIFIPSYRGKTSIEAPFLKRAARPYVAAQLGDESPNAFNFSIAS
jgi:hypothetical protein